MADFMAGKFLFCDQYWTRLIYTASYPQMVGGVLLHRWSQSLKQTKLLNSFGYLKLSMWKVDRLPVVIPRYIKGTRWCMGELFESWLNWMVWDHAPVEIEQNFLVKP